MRRRASWKPLLLATLALCAPACARARRPNLLLVSIDTTRADHLGAYGYKGARTPHLDALAAEGFLFQRHLTPVPITLPSHTTLLTGLFPPNHTVHDNGSFVVPRDALTLAEVLQQAGYDTSAFVGSFPMTSRFGLDQGFDRYDDTLVRNEQDRQRQAIDIFFDERPASAVVDAALRDHRERTRRPFFMFVHVFDPHQPQMPPAPYDVEFRDRPYDGEIAFVDEQLGRLFSRLQETGEWEHTVVVATADHGEGLGEHGELTHAILLHQATLHIPLIMRGPGVPRGRTDAWTSSTQVFATLLDLLGVPAPADGKPRGEDLRPLMAAGGRRAPAAAPFRSYFETVAPRTSQGWSHLVGFMQDDWRFIHAPRPELYDLGRDPGEQQNRNPDEPQRAQGLREDLRRFLAQNQTRSVAESQGQLDTETAERLAALGYIQAHQESLGSLRDLMDLQDFPDPKDRVIDVSTYSEAKSAMARRQWAQAESLWQAVLARTPGHSYAHQGLAQLYGMTEQWDACLAQLDLALQLRPDATHLRRFRGAIRIQLGQIEAGLADLEGLPTDSVEACTWLGMAHQRLGHAEKAKEFFRKGLTLDPRQRWLRLYLANQLASERSFTEAEALYRALLADDPYFHLSHYNYGHMLVLQGQRERALSLLKRAAQLSPAHEPTRQALRELEGK